MGLSPCDAEDTTQGFFEQIIGREIMSRVAPEAGKLRSYLIASLKNFVYQARRRETQKKRGGGAKVISIDELDPEGNYLADVLDGENPEAGFNRRWAVAVLDAAIVRLRESYHGRGEDELFAALSPLLAGADRGTEYGDVAKQTGKSEGAVRVAVFRLRKRYRGCVREEIAETVSSAAEIDQEIENLFAAVMR
ncbi:MAG: DNA-directed RNA polymerase specialized sigma24 family protein [Verrucomicrobiales bacterium]|jgi:DNA-directed RNA polymerase specialized sigma24 family protein